MRPYLYSGGNFVHFQWNVDCSVGNGGANNLPADVSCIQWYYALAAMHPLTPQNRKVIYRQVQVTRMCSGRDTDPLVSAILEHPRALGHPQIDGRVSVAQRDGRVGAAAYFVLRLGARLANMYPNVWPRLDLIPNCPPAVAQAVHCAIPSL